MTYMSYDISVITLMYNNDYNHLYILSPIIHIYIILFVLILLIYIYFD